MPTPPHRPPLTLHGRAFTTDDAAAAGVDRRHLSGNSYIRWGRGLWSCREWAPDAAERNGLREILLPMQHGHPRLLASHLSAAILYDMRLPDRVRQPPTIHLMVFGQTRWPPGAAGVVGHRASLAAEDIWLFGGVRTTGPARTLLDLCAWRDASGRAVLTDDELVAIVDGVIDEHQTGMHAGRKPLRRRADLGRDMEHYSGLRGAARLRRAWDRSVPGVDSPLETQARLVLQRHGLHGWETDVELTVPGHRAVWPDLADRVHRLSVQCDGAVHDDHRQRIRDVERQRATEAAGWREIRVVARDLHVGRWAEAGAEPMLVQMVRAHRRQSR